MTSNDRPAVDTSRKAVERLARYMPMCHAPCADYPACKCAAITATIRAFLALLSERDAALAERDRMRAALETIIAQDWWDAAERHGDETYAVDGHCAEIARAALAPKPLS